ncbi:MAG: anaerobic ribonucleoside-triphosphate reductase activating protein [Burkholderiales bacterium]|jgi:anaerobic ribonucleoside-triphosphate reductase activating protein|nr:anaerobic ribonucleoside-triphosphate reductase activating protein [Burkholderiales bacterium]
MKSVTAFESEALLSSDANRLRIGGLVPFTATDYPGELSAVVFCQGCPWRCAYCHNPHLIPAQTSDAIAWTTIYEWLKGRRGLLDAVVFSGGEPTIQTALLDALDLTRILGFKVGLHTGGIYPRKLQTALPQLDWVGLDIKASREYYKTVTTIADSGEPAFASLAIIKQSGVPYEVRTTVHGALTPATELLRLAQQLSDAGVTRWILQPFRDQGCDNQTLLERANEATVLDEALLKQIRRIVKHTEIRL